MLANLLIFSAVVYARVVVPNDPGLPIEGPRQAGILSLNIPHVSTEELSNGRIPKMNIPHVATEELPPLPTLARRQQFVEPCAEVSASWAAQIPRATGPAYVPAKLAFDCLQSVPVDSRGDIAQIAELREHVQFQSNIAYLKDGVQHHNKKLDVVGSLDRIAADIQRNAFRSEYEVQLAIRRVFSSARDNHFSWISDISEPFQFARPGAVLISVSKDGLELPEVFYLNDFAQQQRFDFTPSAIESINGNKTSDFLNKQAEEAGFHDIDARYNDIFPNQALRSISPEEGTDGPFMQPLAYPGPITDLVFANGTQKRIRNMAMIPPFIDFTNVIDGRSFFRRFCTGQSLNAGLKKKRQAPSAPQPRPTPTGYPRPVIVDESLVLQGYYLNGTDYDDVAVLAIPSFQPTSTNGEDAARTGFQSALRTFLSDATEKKKQRLIIDLRGNGGGTVDLGHELFKQLMPNADGFGGMRYRGNEAFTLFSYAASKLFHNERLKAGNGAFYRQIVADYGFLDFSSLMTADGTPFKSAEDQLGPFKSNKDNFTAIRRYNYSNTETGYTTAPFFVLSGSGNQPASPTQPFKSENILILQDGRCSSTCSVFSQLMREQAGVHTIAIGGRPVKEPAQGIGGTKGAQILNMDFWVQMMVDIIDYTGRVYGRAAAQGLSNSAVGRIARTTQLFVRTAHSSDALILGSTNALDNLRRDDKSGMPLEFVYEAADCRLFNTLESLADPTKLWKLSVDAKWGNGTCVEGSTNHKSSASVMNGEVFNKNQDGGDQSGTSGGPGGSGGSGGSEEGENEGKPTNGADSLSVGRLGMLTTLGVTMLAVL